MNATGLEATLTVAAFFICGRVRQQPPPAGCDHTWEGGGVKVITVCCHFKGSQFP